MPKQKTSSEKPSLKPEQSEVEKSSTPDSPNRSRKKQKTDDPPEMRVVPMQNARPMLAEHPGPVTALEEDPLTEEHTTKPVLFGHSPLSAAFRLDRKSVV